MENCSIRVDSATQRGSVIDVVRMVLGCTSSAANTFFARIKEGGTGYVQRCAGHRINGKGKLTPVADVKTLVEIVFLLPGKTAREFRRQCAAKVCRLLGGDTTLVSEIEQRRAALGGSTPAEIETYEGMPVGFRYLDATDRQSVAKQVVKHELQRQAQALEHQEQAIKRQRCDDMFVRYRGLMNLKVELDDRTKIELRDNVSILTKQDLAMDAGGPSTGTEMTVTQDPSIPTHTLDAEQRGHETVVVAAKLTVRVPPNMSGPIEDIVEQAIRTKLKIPE